MPHSKKPSDYNYFPHMSCFFSATMERFALQMIEFLIEEKNDSFVHIDFEEYDRFVVKKGYDQYDKEIGEPKLNYIQEYFISDEKMSEIWT